MRLFDNRYESHLRKYTLALSMIEHGARICTVTQWTGLSKYCVQNLTKSYGSKTRIKCKRGDPRHSPRTFPNPLRSRAKAWRLRTLRSKCKRYLREWCRMLGRPCQESCTGSA